MSNTIDTKRTRAAAHRGDSSKYLENTLPAIASAIDAGADNDGVEALHGAETGQIDRKVGLFDRGRPHRNGGTGSGGLLSFSSRLMILALESLPAQIAQRSDRYDQQNPTNGA